MTSFVRAENFGKAFLPKKMRPRFASWLQRAGIRRPRYDVVGYSFWASTLISIVVFFAFGYSWLSDSYGAIGVGVGSLAFIFGSVLALFMLFGLILWFYVDMRIYRRTKDIEKVLPEFLQFVGGNLKGGMSFDRALWSSIRPRFGVLANEIQIAAKKVMTGGDVDEALLEFADKYESPTLQRSMELIVEGMRGGGEIVYLIDRVIENLNEAELLKKEMAASVTSYVIFITFIVLLVAPGLFALGFQLLTIVSSFGAKVSGGAASNFPLKLSVGGFDIEMFKQFSMGCLAIISVFSCMILSIISKGSYRDGIKYVPVFLVVSLVNYLLMIKLLGGVFTFI